VISRDGVPGGTAAPSLDACSGVGASGDPENSKNRALAEPQYDVLVRRGRVVPAGWLATPGTLARARRWRCTVRQRHGTTPPRDNVLADAATRCAVSCDRSSLGARRGRQVKTSRRDDATCNRSRRGGATVRKASKQSGAKATIHRVKAPNRKMLSRTERSCIFLLNNH
jgi:hypothetical protein